MSSPEDQARENIDRVLAKSGWAVRDHNKPIEQEESFPNDNYRESA